MKKLIMVIILLFSKQVFSQDRKNCYAAIVKFRIDLGKTKDVVNKVDRKCRNLENPECKKSLYTLQYRLKDMYKESSPVFTKCQPPK